MKKATDIKERIASIDGQRKPAELKVLNLDGYKVENLASVKELIEAHTSLQELSLINMGLNSLVPFPNLPTLRRLSLCDNKLSGGLDHLVASCRGLEVLYLGGNSRIATVELLEPLKNLPNLRILDVFACNIMKVDEFHTKIWAMLPQLVSLDSFDRDGKEVPDSEAEDEGGEDDDEYDSEEEDINNENDTENIADGDDSSDSDDSTQEDESGEGDDSNGSAENDPTGPVASPAPSKGMKRKMEES